MKINWRNYKIIKPYIKSEHSANVVEVEDFGIINLNDLPIEVRKEEKGYYEIGWVLSHNGGKEEHILSEYGGVGMMGFGGRELGVIKKLD
ncbi:hypothetical protein [Priestia aryabhattai]|uniref:hypothetical protein n=1 Tax=Priestia aryabhattai TaxID=412384 RepID=UPI0015F5711E|nr:hypothetical protein [Priestia aryabhattai]